MEPIKSNRTAIETRRKCRKKRFLAEDFRGTGIQARTDGYEKTFGILVHSALQDCLVEGKYVEPTQQTQTIAAVVDAMDFAEEKQRHHTRKEQIWLLKSLVYGWTKFRLQRILSEYTVDSVEKEVLVTFLPNVYLPTDLANVQRPLQMPLRRDAVLKAKHTDEYYILDWKTASRVSDDWNLNLDNSLQSHLYLEGSEVESGNNYAGIFYEGLVKGRRELDKAKSSPFQGQIIQYGSFLYGWKKKDGKVVPSSDYVAGSQRVFLPDAMCVSHPMAFLDGLVQMGVNISSYFPSTIPWKPLDTGFTVGQVIVGENSYRNDVEMYNDAPEGSELKRYYEHLLFEQNLGECFKYGTKHPCEFLQICHGKIHEDEINVFYEPREDHHAEGELV